ncbi:T9SS type A sorting domain-containing protein [candidate division KSB1 bacterium]|nr:T9SS type A sorting domain-containing protein [candidate division KSB1 bacterium]
MIKYNALGLLINVLILSVLFSTAYPKGEINASSEEEGAASYELMFERVWSVYDEYYPYFIHKQINWDSLRFEYQPAFATCNSDSQFVRLLSNLLANLRDFHVGLRLPNGTTICPTFDYPRLIRYNMDWECLPNYVPGIRESEPLFYGITGDNFGYIAIPSWTEQAVEQFNSILFSMQHTDGLIIDVRMNAGGSEIAAQKIASRFATHNAIYAYHRFRQGSRHDDFGALGARNIAPVYDWRYLKPVALLVGVITMSSSESFVLMMDRFPQVVTIGEPTRGCSGNPTELELPNGIKYSVPRWVAFRANHQIFEGIGIAPDIYVPYTDKYKASGTDPILERAIESITSRLKIDNPSISSLPTEYQLNQNYPNPFNTSTLIKFELKERALVSLHISNALGQEIVQLVNEVKEAGTHSVTWDGQDKFGQPTTSGVYLYKIQANDFKDVKKMILLR